ncbi:MAG: phosphoglycerate dehydrogenase [Nannocystaceae bacterium]
MSSPQALLLENVHASASEAYVANEIHVDTASGGMDERQLISALNGFAGEGPVVVGIRSKTRVTQAVFEAVPRLSAIAAYCIGTDQIDLGEARRRGVAVFNAPFSSTRSVAELVVGEVVMLSRQIFRRSNAAHAGKWAKSAAGSHEVRGKTLGIVGYGHIGSQVSVLAEALGMRVAYYDSVAKLPLGNARACSSLHELLGASDFVTLHVPDTATTRGMIGETQLGQMRKDAYLLNLSRGQVVDLDALRGALAREHLAGAAIDVYPREPAKAGDPFDSPLRGQPNVILTPHIGGSTLEAQENIGREVSSSVCSYLRAGRTTGCVTLPQLDAPTLRRGSRIINVHRNIPGVLSDINQAVAESGINIDSQHLATMEGTGLLILDMSIKSVQAPAHALRDAIAGMPTSIRTRLEAP